MFPNPQLRIVLDEMTLKALSVRSRTKILKLVRERRMMQVELAKALGLSQSTVKEHLDLLEKAKLMQSEREGKKWRFYSLTRKGRVLVEPALAREHLFIVLSGLGVAVLAGGLGWFWQQLGVSAPVMREAALEAQAQPVPYMAEAAKAAMPVQDAIGAVQPFPWLLVGYLALLAILLVFAWICWFKARPILRSRPKKTSSH